VRSCAEHRLTCPGKTRNTSHGEIRRCCREGVSRRRGREVSGPGGITAALNEGPFKDLEPPGLVPPERARGAKQIFGLKLRTRTNHKRTPDP